MRWPTATSGPPDGSHEPAEDGRERGLVIVGVLVLGEIAGDLRSVGRLHLEPRMGTEAFHLTAG